MNKVTDMTKGNIFKLILVFAIPLFIGNLFQILYSFFDSVIASRFIGSDALAAIGTTATVVAFIISFSNGIGSGTSLIISKLFGSGNIKKIKNVIVTAVLINIILAAVVTTSVMIGLDGILHLLRVPENIYEMSKEYFMVIILGLIATLTYNTFSGILRALGNSRVPLYALIISCIINITGDLLFIAVFKTGLIGSAIATVIAQSISGIILIIYIIIKYPMLHLEKDDFKLKANMVHEVIITGLSMGLMYSIYTIGGMFMSSSLNELGENIIAARTGARRLVEIWMLVPSSLATSCSVFVSQNYGAKDIKRANQGVIRTLFLAACWAVIILIFIPFFKPLAKIITSTNEPEVVDNTVMCLRINIGFYFPLAVVSIVRLSLQSLQRRIIPFISSCFELTFKMISAFIWIPTMGLLGEAITEPITWNICGLFLLTVYIIYYRKGVFTKMMNKQIAKEQEELIEE